MDTQRVSLQCNISIHIIVGFVSSLIEPYQIMRKLKQGKISIFVLVFSLHTCTFIFSYSVHDLEDTEVEDTDVAISGIDTIELQRHHMRHPKQ